MPAASKSASRCSTLAWPKPTDIPLGDWKGTEEASRRSYAPQREFRTEYSNRIFNKQHVQKCCSAPVSLCKILYRSPPAACWAAPANSSAFSCKASMGFQELTMYTCWQRCWIQVELLNACTQSPGACWLEIRPERSQSQRAGGGTSSTKRLMRCSSGGVVPVCSCPGDSCHCLSLRQESTVGRSTQAHQESAGPSPCMRYTCMYICAQGKSSPGQVQRGAPPPGPLWTPFVTKTACSARVSCRSHCDQHNTAWPRPGPDASQALLQENQDAHELQGMKFCRHPFVRTMAAAASPACDPVSRRPCRGQDQAHCYCQGCCAA